MLRITTHNKREPTTIQLEGKLAGPWVNELQRFWQRLRDDGGAAGVRVDLNAVTFMDAAGKELLAAMHSQGAAFVCTSCLMNAIVAEIKGIQS